MSARLLGSALLACALSSACGPKPPPHARPPAAQEALRSPSALPYDFMWRQRVIAEWPTGTQEFEAVLQKQKGELTLLGLSPMGLPGFVLTLHPDASLSVQNRMGRDLPFEPSYILADVERVFFPWLSPVAADYTGEQSGVVGGQQVQEQYRAGRLIAREFRKSSAPDAGVVRIDYEAAAPGEDAAPRVKLDNGFYRYRLVIETFEQQRL